MVDTQFHIRDSLKVFIQSQAPTLSAGKLSLSVEVREQSKGLNLKAGPAPVCKRSQSSRSTSRKGPEASASMDSCRCLQAAVTQSLQIKR